MATETAEATLPTANAVSGLLDQAYRALGDSFKVALKAQEDTIKFWAEAVGKVNPGQTMAGEWVPTAKRNAEEYLRLLDASYRRNVELVKKAMQTQNGGDNAAMEKRTQEWLEASVSTVRDNAQDLVITSLKVAQAWTEAFRKGSQQAAHSVQNVQQAAQKAAGKQ